MKTVICTSGTSIARGARLLSGQTIDAFRSEIRRRQDDLRNKTAAESYLHAASAETNSVSRLRPERGDIVWLLHIETEDGEICAAETARLLEEHVGLEVRLRRIEGLQVNDAQRFRRTGIRALFDALREICEPLLGSQDQEIILNATGGFKSVVPFVTLFGLLNRLDVVYIFEQSEALLRLPPVPLNFDYERLGQARQALLRLEEAATMPREEFFKLIPGIDYAQRDFYASLLEEDDRGEVMLSGFAQMLLYQSRSVDQCEVWLHPNALRSYEASQGLLREVFDHLLARVRDPLWRQAKVHAFHSSDIPCFKPGRTAERMFCFVRGNRVHVCELFGNYREYDRFRGRLADYIIGEFRQWQQPAGSAPTSSTDELTEEWQARLDSSVRESEQLLDALDRMERERDQMKGDLEAGREESRKTSAEAEEKARYLEVRLEDLAKSVSELSIKKDVLQTRISTLEATLRNCEPALRYCRLPFWRRLWSRPPGTPEALC
jgi:putative CRISPR-associated protein (TIGR02619 family)